MVLAWNIVDTRYRFRTRTAPLPLQLITFSIVVAVGCLSLLTDLWRAQRWFVPRGDIMTPAEWQAVLAFSYLLTFLTWAWFAFIRPPTYTKRNAKRYASALYHSILQGSPTELAVIADELRLSAYSLVCYAPDWDARKRRNPRNQEDDDPKLTDVEEIADDILLLIANPRFCRTIVEASSATALEFFRAVGETKRYGVRIGVFARNILNEAIANKDSFIFTETEGYESGLVGYQKPLMQAMFSNYRMVEAINVFGFTVPKSDHYRSSKALQTAALKWTKKNYARVHAYDPKIAAACLVDGFTYEPENLRLVHTRQEGMRRRTSHTYFYVDPSPGGDSPDLELH